MKTLLKQIIVFSLTLEAKLLLKRHRPIIIAITGSVGKTAMKDAIYTILRPHVSARKSEKSFNSEIGVPLTVLGLPNAWNNPFLWIKNLLDGLFIALFSKEYPSYLILETGVDRPGDMDRLTAWMKPDIVVLTRLPDIPVHVEFFSSPEAVVQEKMKLVTALRPEGVVIYNHDDPIILRELNNIRQAAFGFGRYAPTHFTAKADTIYYHDDVPAGISFDVTHLNESVKVKVMGAVGLPLVYTYTGALAVAMQCGVSLPAASAALLEHQVPPGRMRVLKGIKGSIIIDDTYNASPIAVSEALRTLKEIAHAGRRIAVLGDMLELGKFSQREHENIGVIAASTVDVLFTIGIRSQKTATAALGHGLSEKNIFQYEDAERAGKELQMFIQPGDVILVKASQGIRAERVVEEVMAEPERAFELLVRQDSAWQER